MQDAELIRKNSCEYAGTHKKAIEVLRRADGRQSYSKIAETVSIHGTTVSSLLRKAEKFGLAKKIKPGVYQKVAGVLGFMPKKSHVVTAGGVTINDLTKKIDRLKNLPKTQFPTGLVIQTRIYSSLDKMVTAYQSLYAVENSLRELIRRVFKNDINWWTRRVPIGVQGSVKKNIIDTPYHAASRTDELEYTHLWQLKEIIIFEKNWHFFLPYLKTKDKSDFSATINKAIASRNAIGHCIPLIVKDLRIVDVRLRDILEMIR